MVISHLTAICFIGFRLRAKPLINIHDFLVLPTSRGKGIGRRLLKASKLGELVVQADAGGYGKNQAVPCIKRPVLNATLCKQKQARQFLCPSRCSDSANCAHQHP
jgi:GNAT superfamily N-acetyltransferase